MHAIWNAINVVWQKLAGKRKENKPGEFTFINCNNCTIIVSSERKQINLTDNSGKKIDKQML